MNAASKKPPRKGAPRKPRPTLATVMKENADLRHQLAAARDQALKAQRYNAPDAATPPIAPEVDLPLKVRPLDGERMAEALQSAAAFAWCMSEHAERDEKLRAKEEELAKMQEEIRELEHKQGRAMVTLEDLVDDFTDACIDLIEGGHYRLFAMLPVGDLSSLKEAFDISPVGCTSGSQTDELRRLIERTIAAQFPLK